MPKLSTLKKLEQKELGEIKEAEEKELVELLREEAAKSSLHQDIPPQNGFYIGLHMYYMAKLILLDNKHGQYFQLNQYTKTLIVSSGEAPVERYELTRNKRHMQVAVDEEGRVEEVLYKHEDSEGNHSKQSYLQCTYYHEDNANKERLTKMELMKPDAESNICTEYYYSVQDEENEKYSTDCYKKKREFENGTFIQGEMNPDGTVIALDWYDKDGNKTKELDPSEELKSAAEPKEEGLWTKLKRCCWPEPQWEPRKEDLVRYLKQMEHNQQERNQLNLILPGGSKGNLVQIQSNVTVKTPLSAKNT